MPPKLFNKGDKIEVRKAVAGVIWYPATVVCSSRNQMDVEYETLTEDGDPTSSLLMDCVSVGDARPTPPPEMHRYFKVGEEVEAFVKEKRGWRKGRVAEILEDSMYSVSFEGEEGSDHFVEVEHWRLRAFREWDGGQWVPAFYLQELLQLQKSPESEVKPRGLKLKIKFGGKASKANFNEGMLVEIKSDKDGYRGSWYTAVIVEPLANDKFLVEYRTLNNEDKTELLKDEVNISCIRPSPPFIQHIKPFDCLQRVDSWYNDGWWEGYIVKVMNACNYTVHFTNGDKEMEFQHSKLRPHQIWLDGKWTIASKVKMTEEELKTNQVKLKRKHNKQASVPTFGYGMTVEVKSDEEGYQGSWFTAVIVSSIDSDSFLVEYQTLKTNEDTELLREKVYASNIRPCPPELARIDRYRVLDDVDAWYNDGWWVGRVSGVLDDLRYAVYFWTTNEEIIFKHFSLRPHQEWTGGKWTVASRKRRNLTKIKLEMCKGQNGGMRARPEFTNGMKVEVKSDQKGYLGSWYTASIVKPLEGQQYLVEYQTLLTDDETELLKEEACSSCIRPCPPLVQKNDEYKPCEEVDVWYNDGWWVGRICEILDGSKYKVYFNITNEILEFQRSALRPHQDWINQQWFLAKA